MSHKDDDDDGGDDDDDDSGVISTRTQLLSDVAKSRMPNLFMPFCVLHTAEPRQIRPSTATNSACLFLHSVAENDSDGTERCV